MKQGFCFDFIKIIGKVLRAKQTFEKLGKSGKGSYDKSVERFQKDIKTELLALRRKGKISVKEYNKYLKQITIN